MKRRNAVIGFLVIVIAAAGLGWVLGSRITSPAEIAARTAAPEPSAILVPAEVRFLSTNVVTRGTGRFGAPRDITLPPSVLKVAPLVVTSLPALDLEIGDGDVLMTASGRPVIVLEGDSPAYRDLGPDMVGADVMQLEQALDRLGHDPGPIDGAYDADTEDAVRGLYERYGFSPAEATSGQIADLVDPQTALFAGSTPTGGVLVPADEIIFLSGLPARVTSLELGVGDAIDGVILTVANSTVSIDGSLPIESSGLVRPGMAVEIDEPDLGIEAAGVVSHVASGPGTNGVDGFHVYFEVAVEEAPPNLVNASVRLTIPVESTDEAVLAVPVTALRLASDGSSVVEVQRADGFDSVAVTPGLSAQGFVEVTARNGELQRGDLVLIGFDTTASTEPSG